MSNDGLAVEYLAEDDVLAVEVRGRDGGYEELGAVGVWRGNSSASWPKMRGIMELTGTSIGHGQEERLLMLHGESFIVKLVAIDGLSAGAVTSSKVTTLDHELLDDTMEDGALVVQGLSRLADALFTGAESTEVLSSLGDKVGIEFHGDTANGLAAERDIEEDAGSRGGVAFGSHCDSL